MTLSNQVESYLSSVANTIFQWEGVERVRFISNDGLDSTILDVDVLISSSKYLVLHKLLFDLLLASDHELGKMTESMWYLSGLITQQDRPLLPNEEIILELN